MTEFGAWAKSIESSTKQRCTICKVFKMRDQFSEFVNRHGAKQRNARCKPCDVKYNKERRDKAKEDKA